jgi:hypothetical protein
MFGFGKGEKDRAISVAVLVNGARELSQDELIASLKKRGIKAERGKDAPRESLGMTFNDQPMMIVPEFPAVPPGQLLELCEGAWWWPEAHEKTRNHTHVVAIGVPEGRGDRLERRRLASEVALAIARQHEGAAILWRDGELLYEPDLAERVLNAASLPTPIWISIRVAQHGTTKFFFTTGLEAFEHREIEMDVPPRESLDQAALLHDLMGWALRHRTRLVPGGSIGRTPGERLVVSIEASRIPGRRDVVRLTA